MFVARKEDCFILFKIDNKNVRASSSILIFPETRSTEIEALQIRSAAFVFDVAGSCKPRENLRWKMIRISSEWTAPRVSTSGFLVAAEGEFQRRGWHFCPCLAYSPRSARVFAITARNRAHKLAATFTIDFARTTRLMNLSATMQRVA